LTFVPAASVTVKDDAGALKTYTFNAHRLRHRFCQTCGVQPFAEGVGPDGAETRAINLRCVPSIEIEALQIESINGAAF
jgi:hypothetical protein